MSQRLSLDAYEKSGSLSSLNISVQIYLHTLHCGRFKPIVNFQSTCFVQVSRSTEAIPLHFEVELISLINLSKCQIVQFGDIEYHHALDIKNAGLTAFSNRRRDSIQMKNGQTTICDT